MIVSAKHIWEGVTEYSVLGFGHCIGSSDVIMRFFQGE